MKVRAKIWGQEPFSRRDMILAMKKVMLKHLLFEFGASISREYIEPVRKSPFDSETPFKY